MKSLWVWFRGFSTVFQIDFGEFVSISLSFCCFQWASDFLYFLWRSLGFLSKDSLKSQGFDGICLGLLLFHAQGTGIAFSISSECMRYEEKGPDMFFVPRVRCEAALSITLESFIRMSYQVEPNDRCS